VKLLIILLLGCALFAGACANDSADDNSPRQHHRHGNGRGQTETNNSSDNPSPTPALGL
jgi:hypothetical protein